jgi:hypothetical protein
MLCIWDRLFGTHVVLDSLAPPEYGTKRGYATHDGAKAQWVLWADLWRLVRRAHSTRERARVLFGRPGTTPSGVTLPPLPSPPPANAISRATKMYVAVQLALTMTCSLWVFVLRERHTWLVTGLSAVAITWALTSLGGLLDARPHVRRWEIARLASMAALGVALLTIL